MPASTRKPKPAKKPAASSPPWLTVRNSAEADATEVLVCGPIGGGWWDESGVSSKEFREQFNAIPKGRQVHVRINSEGGSVSDALEIYNVIQRRADDVTCFNDGYALSSASIILLAGGTVVCPHSSLTMIHEPWSMTIGNEEDHRRSAEMLSKHGDTIAGIYARRTGKTLQECRDAMRVETWFTGDEALDYGLSDECDEVEEGAEGGAYDMSSSDVLPRFDMPAVLAKFAKLDISQFHNVPEKVLVLLGRTAPAVINAPRTPVSTPQQNSPTPPIMDRKKILAALKSRGITLAEDATDEQILAEFNKLSIAAAPAAPPAPAPAPVPQNAPAPAANVVDKAEFEAIKAQLAAEKRTRIENEVRRRGENRIENGQIAFYVENALRNETATYAAIDAMPVNLPGGQPLAIGAIQVSDTRLEQIRNEPAPSKRYGMVLNEWEGLFPDAVARDARRGTGVQNSNSYSATLVTAFLADGFVTKLQNRWAPLKSFARDFSVDRMKPLSVGHIPMATAGSTTQTDATNFETSGDSTVTPISVTPHQYTQGFHVSNADLNSGLRMENLIEINTAAFADKILAVAFVPVTTANFTGTAITAADAAFGWTEMAEAWGLLKKSSIRHAILDGEYMARLLNNPAYLQAALTADGSGARAFGWDGVHLNTNWTGAGSNVRGFFCNPQAIGALSGLPLTPPQGIPGNSLQEKTIVVPDVNIPIAAYNWFSLGSRTLWASFDVMFGVAAGDTTAGFILKSA
jgi:ATP-dependent protease ClpP protease subunit